MVSGVNLEQNPYAQLSFKGKKKIDNPKVATTDLADVTKEIQGSHAAPRVSDTAFAKNPMQVLSFAPEHGGLKKLGLNNYVEGGLACVAQEAPESWVKAGLDVRSFVPYHAPNNPKGKIIVATIEKSMHLSEKQNIIQDFDSQPGAVPTVFEESRKRFSKTSGVTNSSIATVKETYPEYLKPSQMKYVDRDYTLKPGEHFVVVNPDKTKSGLFKYALIEDTGIKGSITALKESSLEKEQIPYRIFQYIDKTGKPVTGKDTVYFVHTPQVAVMPKAYGKGLTYAPGQIIGSWWDLYYANCNRCVADAMPQLAEKGFNPANIWMHDRPAFALQDEIARRSADGDKFYSGFKMHSTFHNPGRDYQGFYEDPIGFMRIAFNEKDFDKLQASPDFQELLDLEARRHGKLSEADIARRKQILDPYFKRFFDDTGKPNISMVAVANTNLNSANASSGTVSMTYGSEMKKLSDIAKGMTKALNETNTVDITNGSTPANLNLDKVTDFGLGGNGLSTEKAGYTPYKPILEKGELVNFTAEKGVLFGPDGKPVKEDVAKAIQKNASKRISKLQTESWKLAKKYMKTKAKVETLTGAEASKIEKLKANLEGYLKRLAQIPTDIDTLNKSSNYSYSIKEAKQKNKEWLVNLIGSCMDKDGKIDQKALNSLFFNDGQLSGQKPAQVLGCLSKFQKGDKVFSSWGRPDPQKGFSTLLQGFHKFLTDKSVPDEQKIHSKLLLGSGPVWDKSASDYKIIKEYVDKIRTMENGKYAGNVCYVDGFFPNKLVACSDWTIFSSRFEPCGITPLESFSSSTPVLSIRTGGAPDFVSHYDGKAESLKAANGMLTDDPFMIEAKELGLVKTPEMSQKEFERILDEKRRAKLSDEIADLFKSANNVDEKTYNELAQNACKQSVDWHENAAYNHGKTANERYFGEVFELEKKGDKTYGFAKKRSTRKMQKLTGEFGDSSQTRVVVAENVVDKSLKRAKDYATEVVESGSKFFSRLLHDKRTYIAVASIAAIAGIATYALNRERQEQSNSNMTKIGRSTVYYG